MPPASAAPTTSTPRGIIVLDTNALWDLGVTLPEAFLSDAGKIRALARPVHLSDALIYLAKHGYEVVIPEMVAYEAGGFMRDGHSTSKYFIKEKRQTKQDMYPFIHHAMEALLEAQKDGANIRIQPASKSSMSPESLFMDHVFKEHQSDNSLTKKCAHLIYIDRRKPVAGAGERAAAEMILDQYQHDRHTPIFFLSNDKGARNLITAKCPQQNINFLGSGAFYIALKQVGLLDQIGVDSEISPDAIAHNIDNKFKAINQQNLGFISVPGMSDYRSGEHPQNMSARPFSTSLKNLRAALDLTEQSQPATQEEQEKPSAGADSGRAAAFLAKYGSRKPGNTGAHSR